MQSHETVKLHRMPFYGRLSPEPNLGGGATNGKGGHERGNILRGFKGPSPLERQRTPTSEYSNSPFQSRHVLRRIFTDIGSIYGCSSTASFRPNAPRASDLLDTNSFHEPANCAYDYERDWGCARTVQKAIRRNSRSTKTANKVSQTADSGVTNRQYPWLTFPTPVPGLPDVTLYRDQWEDHIISRHVEMSGQEQIVGGVVSTPTIVINSPDSSGYYLFVNEDVRSQSGRTPLVVCVDPAERFLVTAYYDSAYKTAVIGTVVWQS